jgi:hypothetical protein
MTIDDAYDGMIEEFRLGKLVHTVDAHGGFSAGSADEFLNQFTAARPYIRSMQHHITTMNFAVSKDFAEGEIYTIAVHTLAAGERHVDVVVGGRYLDKYEKRYGVWKFTARTIVTDWARVTDPSAMDDTHPITRNTLNASPDANDPSHQFFSLLGRA